MSDSVTRFYDALSPFYHDNMGWDWDAVMREEGAILGRLVAQRRARGGPCDLLDCACGIGTQAIGLALQGHRVHANRPQLRVRRLCPARGVPPRCRHDLRRRRFP